ncbi:MAG: hypothetical protein HW383_159 [Candidatus Magasanikbacteria bacterium]|nr:hypothetical protein [Candidatus Magasanikbacteria bacterium]
MPDLSVGFRVDQVSANRSSSSPERNARAGIHRPHWPGRKVGDDVAKHTPKLTIAKKNEPASAPVQQFGTNPPFCGERSPLGEQGGKMVASRRLLYRL